MDMRITNAKRVEINTNILSAALNKKLSGIKGPGLFWKKYLKKALVSSL